MPGPIQFEAEELIALNAALKLAEAQYRSQQVLEFNAEKIAELQRKTRDCERLRERIKEAL